MERTAALCGRGGRCRQPRRRPAPRARRLRGAQCRVRPRCAAGGGGAILREVLSREERTKLDVGELPAACVELTRFPRAAPRGRLLRPRRCATQA